MPVVTLYRHGVSMGVAPMSNQHPRAKRDIVVGWSAGAARRNLRFLYSIDERFLTGEGWALTLTVRDCPASPDLWHRLIRDYFRQLGRLLSSLGHSLIRYHYVTEWQGRGVPHLHGAVYFSDGAGAAINLPNVLTSVWEGYAAPFGARRRGQYVIPITGAVAWFQYVSKHAARGIRHYQRSAANIPESWREGTGRMWGKGGDWPIKEPLRLGVDSRGYHVLRRWARAWRVADARAEIPSLFAALKNPHAYLSAKRRLVSARGCLRCSDLHLSPVRGVSEWIPEHLMLRMIQRLSLDGYQVES